MSSQSIQMDSAQLPVGNFKYSAAKVDLLEATEYTLATLTMDQSGSTTGFAKLIEECAAGAIKALHRSPRADNLMLRATGFGSTVREINGFQPLLSYDPAKCNGWYKPMGMTALFDATIEAVAATEAYAKVLHASDYRSNAIHIVITDGGESGDSKMKLAAVAKQIKSAVTSEILDSNMMVLVGVNVQDPQLSKDLQDFKDQAGFDKYLEIENADEDSLAKLLEFISASVSLTSQVLGTGGLSQAIQSLTI
jgi:uncharacterized protein YegL